MGQTYQTLPFLILFVCVMGVPVFVCVMGVPVFVCVMGVPVFEGTGVHTHNTHNFLGIEIILHKIGEKLPHQVIK